MGTERRAFGTQLKNGATVIGNLISVGLGGLKADMKDTTHHGLTDPYRTRRPTLGDAQAIKAKVQMTSDQFATVWGMFDPTANATTWTVVYPFTSPINVACSGYLTEISVGDAEVDGIIECELTIELTGKPTIS